MLVFVRRRSCLVEAVLTLISLALAGYKADGMIELQANGDTRFDFTFEDSRDSTAKVKQTCETVRTIPLAKVRFVDSPKAEDAIPAGGHLTCEVTSDKPFIGKTRSSERDGKHHFEYYGAHDNNNMDFSDFKTRTVVSTSGKVARLSLGKTQGDEVALEDLDFLTHGVEIAVEKESPGSFSFRMPGGKTDAALSSANGFPAWAWVAIGAGALVVIAGLALIAGRRRGMVKIVVRRQDGMPGGGSCELLPGAGTLASPQQQDSGGGFG